jgi:hypothetical protein
MPIPTINMDQLADNVTAELARRQTLSQAQQREAERLTRERAQRESEQAAENARVQRQMALRELTLLENKEREFKQSLEAKSQEHSSLGKDVQALFGQHNFLLMRLHQMKKQLGL